MVEVPLGFVSSPDCCRGGSAVTVFLLGLTPAYDVWSFMPGVVVMVVVNSKFCSSKVPRDSDQKYQKVSTTYCRKWPTRPEENTYEPILFDLYSACKQSNFYNSLFCPRLYQICNKLLKYLITLEAYRRIKYCGSCINTENVSQSKYQITVNLVLSVKILMIYTCQYISHDSTVQ